MHDNHLPPFVMSKYKGVQKYASNKASDLFMKGGVQMFCSVAGVWCVPCATRERLQVSFVKETKTGIQYNLAGRVYKFLSKSVPRSLIESLNRKAYVFIIYIFGPLNT
jgi:hypothetical protein